MSGLRDFEDEDAYVPQRCTGTVEYIRADGKCMFRAVLRELERLGRFSGTVAAGVDQLRLDLVTWVLYNRDALVSGMTVEEWIYAETTETFDKYTRRMKGLREWGGIIELFALTQVCPLAALWLACCTALPADVKAAAKKNRVEERGQTTSLDSLTTWTSCRPARRRRRRRRRRQRRQRPTAGARTAPRVLLTADRERERAANSDGLTQPRAQENR